MRKRFIKHAGPALEPRVISQSCSVRSFIVKFQPCRTVLQSVTEALEAEGVESAIIEIEEGAFAPLVYVIPAASTDDRYAAWYSDTRCPDGVGQVSRLTMSFGRREGAAIIHCHGIWRHADGYLGAGHLLPQEAAFGDVVTATVHAISGAVLEQQDDMETNFPLLTPIRSGRPRPGEKSAVLLRVKPNTDVHLALAETARAHRISEATVHGNLSFVGCEFADGKFLESYASEAFVRSGLIKEGVPVIDVGVVGMKSDIYQGELSSSGNVICIASELLIVESAPMHLE